MSKTLWFDRWADKGKVWQLSDKRPFQFDGIIDLTNEMVRMRYIDDHSFLMATRQLLEACANEVTL